MRACGAPCTHTNLRFPQACRLSPTHASAETSPYCCLSFLSHLLHVVVVVRRSVCLGPRVGLACAVGMPSTLRSPIYLAAASGRPETKGLAMPVGCRLLVAAVSLGHSPKLSRKVTISILRHQQPWTTRHHHKDATCSADARPLDHKSPAVVRPRVTSHATRHAHQVMAYAPTPLQKPT